MATLVVYIGIFNLWTWIPRAWVIPLGVTVSVFMIVASFKWKKRDYFVNEFDHLWHGVVAVDVFLESILIPDHQGNSFYFCAAAFAVVISAYRIWVWKRKESVHSA